MNREEREQQGQQGQQAPESTQINFISQLQPAMYCTPTADGHCLTCSDEAVPVRVLQVDPQTGLALVAVGNATEEIDVTLVEDVTPGAMLLAHGGVAIGYLDKET